MSAQKRRRLRQIAAASLGAMIGAFALALTLPAAIERAGDGEAAPLFHLDWLRPWIPVLAVLGAALGAITGLVVAGGDWETVPRGEPTPDVIDVEGASSDS